MWAKRSTEEAPAKQGLAPQVLAAVRNAVIHLLTGKESSHAAAIRRLNARPEEALALLDLEPLKKPNSPARTLNPNKKN